MKRIGFIGIGHMGWPMAANLVADGYEVTVCDVSAEVVEKFTSEFSAKGVTKPSDLKDSDFVITMLPNGGIVKDSLTEGNPSLIDLMSAGSVVIDMSSSAPMGTRELGEILKDKNIGMVDAPVSGGVPKAKTGELTIMYGLDDESLKNEVLSVLKALGTNLFYVGALGCGHAVKALNNYAAAASFAATSEALAIGKAFGLDQEVLNDVLNVSTGRNFHTDVVIKQHVLSGKFNLGFACELLAKDVRIASDLGKALDADAPLLSLMEQRWAQASNILGKGHDYSEAHAAWNKK